MSLAEITDNKSGQTGQHVRRVAEYTKVLAEELGYPPERLDDLREAYDEIVRCSGSQFDPAVVEAFKSRYADINAIRQRFSDNVA